jgi:antitoxin HicB
MRFLYPAELWHADPGEVVVSFRDIEGCHTSGTDEADALEEAQDALAEAIAGRINRGDPIPPPSAPVPGEYLVAVPTDMAAKAALVLAFRDSGLKPASLAERLGTDEGTVRRMLDPRHDTASGHIQRALRILGSELVVEVRELVSA